MRTIYEVVWGDRTSRHQAGNPYQACMLTMQENEVPLNPPKVFEVQPFVDGVAGKREKIDLATIVQLMVLSNNYAEEQGETEEHFCHCHGG